MVLGSLWFNKLILILIFLEFDFAIRINLFVQFPKRKLVHLLLFLYLLNTLIFIGSFRSSIIFILNCFIFANIWYWFLMMMLVRFKFLLTALWYKYFWWIWIHYLLIISLRILLYFFEFILTNFIVWWYVTKRMFFTTMLLCRSIIIFIIFNAIDMPIYMGSLQLLWNR